VPAIPSWLLEPLRDQFAALLPDRPVYHPSHPLGCHRPRISDRVVFEKLIQVLRFGCSYESIADCACGATTIRERRDEWIKAAIFGKLKTIARDSYDRMVGLVLEELAVDGCVTKAPGGGECAGPSPVDRRKLGMKRSLLVDGHRWHVERTKCLAQQLQQAAALLRAQRGRHRRLLRPRRHHHHGPQAHPRSADPLPMGHPTSETAMIKHLSVRTLNGYSGQLSERPRGSASN
jgi:transposase